ncbi:ATP-binding protein [uncultured Paludibaculum sp.]|uniref:ATP-binding protein n=1 Tax=uncultured Paludibaculum sp. TaxID=1765020 RepID=UPI002AAAEE97|nr:ATP-binding protein [uncultured Paludibaculum sp.]
MSNLENPNNVIVDEYLESSLDSVDSSEERAKVAAEQVGLPEDDAYQVGYAVREAMVNAIVHGNRYSANKRVHFVLSRTKSSIQVLIEDEGTGFLPDQQADPLAEENLLSQSGRGIMIIRSFVDEFVIEKSERGGTRVVLRKSIPPGT